MQNKRDQVQSHLCVVGRLNAAIVSGDPDTPDPPMKRITSGTIIGGVIGALVVAGFGIYGLIRPGGSKDWKAEGSLISVKESSARYVYLKGALHPVVNVASGRLISGRNNKVISVSEKTLAGTPRGLPVGIQGAPDALPKSDKLLGRDWLVCATPRTSAAGTVTDLTLVTLNVPVPASATGADEAVLVQTRNGQKHLLWKGRRYRFATAAGPLSLGYRDTVAFRVADQWINILPAGSDLAPPAVPGRGRPGPVLGGRATRLGQVFVTENPGTAKQYFVLLADGLHQVSETVADLLLGDPVSTAAYGGGPVRAVPLAPAAAAGSLANAPLAGADLPGVPPAVRQQGGNDRPVCASGKAGSPRGATVQIVVPASGAPAGGVPVTDADPRTAASVLVRSGTGALVQSLPAPGNRTGTRYLITDVGVKFPVPSDDDLGALGYAGVAPVPVPPAVLELLPSGPPLNRTAAAQTQITRA
ncbi:type VII secretion protein EccB [Actinomadura sp. 6N118]|uniref:type VII secretion protein EccB n=1 Tax=Actinomadura sp. 6N118 TaxID=3375151 RepID=UPI0037AE6C37